MGNKLDRHVGNCPDKVWISHLDLPDHIVFSILAKTVPGSFVYLLRSNKNINQFIYKRRKNFNIYVRNFISIHYDNAKLDIEVSQRNGVGSNEAYKPLAIPSFYDIEYFHFDQLRGLLGDSEELPIPKATFCKITGWNYKYFNALQRRGIKKTILCNYITNEQLIDFDRLSKMNMEVLYHFGFSTFLDGEPKMQAILSNIATDNQYLKISFSFGWTLPNEAFGFLQRIIAGEYPNMKTASFYLGERNRIVVENFLCVSCIFCREKVPTCPDGLLPTLKLWALQTNRADFIICELILQDSGRKFIISRDLEVLLYIHLDDFPKTVCSELRAIWERKEWKTEL